MSKGENMETDKTHPMRRILIGIGSLSFFLYTMVIPHTVHAQTMADYTAAPPFVSENVPPNVLLVMDNSGSMNESAYHPSGEAYDPAKEYRGYFALGKCYSYASSKFNPITNTAATGAPCSSGAPWLVIFSIT
jgi:hypothetical protein